MFQICICNDHLHQNCSKSLSNTRCSRINMQFFIILYDQFNASGIRNSNSYTGIFHRTSDSNRFSRCHCCIIIFFYCFQGFYQSGRCIYDLTVRKDFSRTDCITVTDLPRCDSNLVSHHIQQRLCCKTGLCNPKSPERSSRWIIGIIRSPFNIKILIMIWSCRMRTGTFQYRTTK